MIAVSPSLTNRELIILLLGSARDFEHTPEGATAKLQRRQTIRGPAPSRREPCPACGGEGVLFDKFKQARPCVRCGGRMMLDNEFVPFHPGRGWIDVDSYTGSEVGTETTGVVRHVRMVLCDGCGGDGMRHGERCRYCDGVGKREAPRDALRLAHANGTTRPVEVFNDPQIAPNARWRAAGSYAELDAALAELEAVWPFGRRLVERVYESGEQRAGDLSPVLRKYLEAAMRVLERKMPRRIRVPRSVIDAAAYRAVRSSHGWRSVEERNRDLKRLRAEGVSFSELQALAQLSRSQLYDVLGRTG